MIHTVTLNPAIDTIVYLDQFVRNITNRIRRVKRTMGGKGTHVSMNLALMGSASVALGFGFGENGRTIIDMLEHSGVTPRFVYDRNGESRVNYMLIEEDTHDCTLIADKGPLPNGEQVETLYRLMDESISCRDYVALSGDTSNFPDPDIYCKLMERLEGRHPRFFLDASGESLRRGIQRRPFLVKPNSDELGMLTGLTVQSERDVIDAIRSLDPLRIEVIAVSLGGEGSIVRAGDEMFRVTPPKVNVYNTVGCGDCFVAGLLHGYANERDILSILRYATAASAAAAECELSVGFDPARAEVLEAQVKIEKR